MNTVEGIKLGAIIVIIIGVLTYWYSLSNTIADQKNQIMTLEMVLNKQNAAILASGQAREELQSRLKLVSKNNEKLQTENFKLKQNVLARPSATTCEEVMSNLHETAKNVALEFNKK